MKNDSKIKWYDKQSILILLFFFIPILGIYGIIKYSTKQWKKILYILLALPLSFIQLFFILSLIIIPFTSDSLDNSKVKNSSDPDIVEVPNKNAEIDLKREEEINIEEEERKDSLIIEHRRFWSDSIVKFWNGDFIVGTDLKKQDTIAFLFSKNATRNYKLNSEMYFSIYSENFVESVKNKFNDTLRDSNLVIHFLGNQKEFEEQRAVRSRKEEILQQFNPFSMEHRKLKRLVKSGMHDPDSYDHISTTFEDKSSYVLINTTFRGKNVYGATVVSNVIAKADLDGNIINVINQN